MQSIKLKVLAPKLIPLHNKDGHPLRERQREKQDTGEENLATEKEKRNNSIHNSR